MSNNKTIEHTGIVKKIDNNSIIVGIIKNSGCASCQAKESCNVSDVEEKEIEIRNFENDFSIGEQVKVYFSESLGFRALFLGYVLPFLIVFIVLIILTGAGADEGLSGLLALGSLPPYYLIIFIVKNKLKKTFSFSIKKLIHRDLFESIEQYN